MLDVYRKRARQFFFASVGLLSLIFFASSVLYPYFRLPLPTRLVLYLNAMVLVLGILCIPLALFLRRRLFPVNSEEDPYWSYTATRRYFWLFVLVNLPFLVALLFYIIFAPLSTLLIGYFVSLYGLILLRPRKEDLT